MENLNIEAQQTMKYGDEVVLYIDHETFNLIKLKEKGDTDNKFGKFKHEFFVGKTFGSKIFSMNKKGYLYALKLSPDFFTKTLLHRTQILYFPDISLVVHKLGLKSGSVIVESGALMRDWKRIDDFLFGKSSGPKRKSFHFRV